MYKTTDDNALDGVVRDFVVAFRTLEPSFAAGSADRDLTGFDTVSIVKFPFRALSGA